jgi:GNAT superfamily N-acetyltransferase
MIDERVRLKHHPASGVVSSTIGAGDPILTNDSDIRATAPIPEPCKLSSVQIEEGAYRLRRWTETTHRVLNGVTEFASSKQTINNIKALRLPTEFTYTWIEIIKIGESSRGRGYGTQVFDWIKATRRATLLGLNPQEIASDCAIEAILKFYRKQGFQLSRFDNEWYGFLYLP